MKLKKKERELNLWLFEDYAPKLPDFEKLPFFPNPKDDNEKLFNLQFRYRVNGDKTALSEMYAVCKNICRKLFHKEINAVKKRQLSIDEKAQDCAAYIVEQFLSRDDFAIKQSFTAYCYLRVQHELFYLPKSYSIVDFVDKDFFNCIAETRNE